MEGSGVSDSTGHPLTSGVLDHPGDDRGDGPGNSPRVFNGAAMLGGPCTAPGGGPGGGSASAPEYRLLELLRMDGDESRSHCICEMLSAGLPDSHTLLQMGISALQLLFLSPRDGQLVKASLQASLHKTATPFSRQRDVMPLPLPCIGAALQLLELCSRTSEGLLIWRPDSIAKQKKQKLRKTIKAGTSQVWRLLVIAVLNGEACGWSSTFFPSRDKPPSSAQANALNHISRLVEYFVRSPLDVRPGRSFEDIVRSKGIDYSGEEVLHALPVKLGEILPGLPADHVAGSLQAASVATDEVLRWVLDPTLCILPDDQWPNPIPSASMNCDRTEWVQVAKLLVQKKILAPISEDSILKVRGKLLLNGIFCVEKKGVPAPGQQRVTRLIMNCVPSNSIQRLMVGDLPTLSSASQWTAAFLRPSQVLLWSGDDQKGAYYAWALPEAWRSLLAFRWPVPGKEVGLPHLESVYLASAVIPMGWLNAVSLFQHLHRKLGISPVPAGAGLREEQEWRRDRAIPASATSLNGGWIQYYLDDFDCPEFVSRADWARLQGTLSATHRRQRASYARQGVGISPDKAHVRELRVTRMGAHIDGESGYIAVPPEKILEVGWMCIWLLGQRAVRQKALLMTLGRFVRCFEFRRPLMGLLNDVWPRKHFFFRRALKASAIRELIRSLCCLPLALSSIRTPPSGLVTCSDASLHGGGLCASSGLTADGKRVLQNLEAGDVPAFRPSGAMDYNSGAGPRVMAVSLWDGIGALVCSLARLPCQVVGFASAETDKDSKRLIRRRWPGVLELGSVIDIDRALVERLARSLNRKLDLVIVGASCPCQDFSPIARDERAPKAEASQTLFEIARVLKLLKQVFDVPVHFFVENVFNMTAENLALVNVVLETTPVLIDAKWTSWCRRPRLFWCSWEVSPLEGEKLIHHDSYLELKLPLTRGESSTWLEKDCSWNGRQNDWLPPIARPRRCTRPPRDPAGLDQASPEAIDRWKHDHFRLQVCNYETNMLISTADGRLRVPSPSESEILMGFDSGYITQALSPKLSDEEVSDLVGKMLGGSLHVHVIVVLMHSLLIQFGLPRVRNLSGLLRLQDRASAGWLLYPRFVPKSLETSDTASLVLQFIRQAERGGTDIRLDVGVPFRMQAWPRSGINSSLFNWSVVHGYSWKSTAHINALELQAVLNSVKWRLRKQHREPYRALHLIDSQVVCAIITKGRTSSYRLRRGLKQLNALLLASGMVLIIGYVNTDCNPSDVPSRWAEKRLNHTSANNANNQERARL